MVLMTKNCLKLLFKREKFFGLQEKDLIEYVQKQIAHAQERQDRQEARQLELAAITEETARQKELEEAPRQTAKDETARVICYERKKTARQLELAARKEKKTDRQLELAAIEEKTDR